MNKKVKHFSILLTLFVVFSLISPAFANAATPPVSTTTPSSNSGDSVNIVDKQATNQTKSLFAYLNGIRGKSVLFGHQHDTDEVLGTNPSTNQGLPSDVYNDVGDYPAVFGWDTLSIEGKEKPGVSGNVTQSIKNLQASMESVYKKGGILTLSSHMPNFVTGGSFNDTSGGDVVSQILPGGAKNADFNAFLDNIATFANGLKDENGHLIPVLYRPLHEANGSWFWWGAKNTTPSEYKELYRYIVEYLRDKKGVHNFLYVYSPNGPFSGSSDNYLSLYPGDQYVDILGMDQYDNLDNAGSQNFLNAVVSDLSMISKLADEKGKIATFSEFGYSPQGMAASKVTDKTWFTDVLNAIKSDPNAKKIAYMLTWADFNTSDNFFVPYKNAKDGSGDHPLLGDFQNFYKDSYTSFLSNIDHSNVYSQNVTATAAQPFMHVVSPTESEAITTNSNSIRASVLNFTPTKVTYSVDGSSTETPMTLNSTSGYYESNWTPSAADNGGTATITVKAYNGDTVAQTQTVKVFVQVPELLMKNYTFDSGLEGGVQTNGAYSASGDLAVSGIEQATLGGDGKLKMDVTGLNPADTWQELKLEFKTISQDADLSNVKRVKLDAWIPASAGADNATATVSAMAMLPQDWNTKYGTTSTQQKFSDLKTVTIDGKDYKKFSATIDLTDASARSAASDLALSLVGNGLKLDSGSVYVDNVQLINTYVQAVQDPSVVDDFESYFGDNAALQKYFVHAGGGKTNVSLDGTQKSQGTYGLKFDYSLTGSGSYAGITKSLGDVDWSSANQLKFWMNPDGSNQKLVIQIKIGGISFEAYPSLSSKTAGYVSIPFSEFKPAPWDTANAGKVITKDLLKHVTDFSIYVNAVGNTTLDSSLYFDDIHVTNDGTGGVPNGGSGPGSMPEQPGVLYDFENGVQGWQTDAGVNQANATDASTTDQEAASGTHSLTSTFDLTKAAGFELDKLQAADLSGVDTISVKVKLSKGTANARLYLKTGSGWAWTDSGVTSVDSSGFKTLTIPLKGVADRNSVQAIGVKIEPTSGSGTANVYVDDVALSTNSDNGGSTGNGGTTDNGGSTGNGGTTDNGGSAGNGGTTDNGGSTGNGGTTDNGGSTGNKTVTLIPGNSHAVPVQAGGTIILSDSHAAVILPKDLPSGTTVKVQALDSNNSEVKKAGNLKLAGDVYHFDFTYPKGHEGFTGQFKLTLSYDVSKFSANQVGIYYYNESTCKWELQKGTVDASAGTITATVPHFSTYGVFAKNSSKQSTGSNSNGTNSGDLPNTGTNNFNWLVIGLGLILIGSAFFLFYRKKLIKE